MTLVDTGWVKDLVDDLGPSAEVQYDPEPLLSLLAQLVGDQIVDQPVERFVEVGGPVPKIDDTLDDFSSDRGMM